MAKGPTRTDSFALTDSLYHEVDEIPWVEIEAATEAIFSEDQRQEIFNCTEIYSTKLSNEKKAASVAAQDELRDSLLEHSRPLIDIAERCIREFRNISKPGDPLKEAFYALNEHLSVRSGSLREAMHKAVEHLSLIVAAIESSTYHENRKTRSSIPESEALARFVEVVLKSAEVEPARGRRAKDLRSRTPSEHRRWGIAVGPRAKQFRTLSEWVLKRKISPDQMKRAFERAHESLSSSTRSHSGE